MTPEDVAVNTNVLHGKYTGTHHAYRQSGSYSLLKNQEIYRGAYSTGDCDCDCGVGEVSGRTAYDDIDPDDPDQVVKHPIVYFGGNASCRISHTSWDPNEESPDIVSQNDEFHYPDATTSHPTAADALAAYDTYRAMVEICDVDVPAKPDYNADGQDYTAQFDGQSSEDNRNDDIELTIEIQES